MSEEDKEMFNSVLKRLIEQYNIKVKILENGALVFYYWDGKEVDMFRPYSGSLLFNLDKLCSIIYEIRWPRKKEEHSILNDFMEEGDWKWLT